MRRPTVAIHPPLGSTVAWLVRLLTLPPCLSLYFYFYFYLFFAIVFARLLFSRFAEPPLQRHMVVMQDVLYAPSLWCMVDKPNSSPSVLGNHTPSRAIPLRHTLRFFCKRARSVLLSLSVTTRPSQQFGFKSLAAESQKIRNDEQKRDEECQRYQMQ